MTGQNKPLLLDLFCGAGGAARGYQLAGFECVGVDHKHQRRYVGADFVQSDVLEYLSRITATGEIKKFSVIHASPPCQGYSNMRFRFPKKDYPLLIDAVRELIVQTGLPYVIENVEGSPIADHPLFKTYAITLCGNSFGLRVYRHRLFESNFPLIEPKHKTHLVRCAPQGRPARPDQFVIVTGNCSGVATARLAMGIDWMTRDELSQAIPPAYTKFIGKQLIAAVRRTDRDYDSRQRQSA